jgi:hypothetical protein
MSVWKMRARRASVVRISPTGDCSHPYQLKGDDGSSIKDYNAAMDHGLMVADALTNGIVAQFPSKFSAK